MIITLQQKRKLAAWKAVNTNRYRNIEKVQNFPALLNLVDDIRQAEYDYEDAYTREAFIAKNIGSTTYRSFLRYNDRNNASPGLILFWIRNNGIPLDEQAIYMSNDYGHEILPEEIGEFIQRHERGMEAYEPIRKINEMKRVFKEEAGFIYNYNWIKTHLIIEEKTEPLPF